MLDAHPAPPAPARPPAAVSAPAIVQPAAPDSPSTSASLLAAARALLPVLESGRALDACSLREAMTRAFGASDAAGAWVWKDSYEAAEAALVLFLQRYGRAMRREAGAGPGGPAAMLRMLETLAALEPSQTRRSEEQLRLQQFSTPLPLAYAALQAAAIRSGDVVLEPSAGTGMLAVMAQCALGKESAAALHLNEIAATRAGLLAGPVSGQHGHPPQRRVHQRPPAGVAAHRGADEPALLGEPRRRPHPARRGPAPHPLGLLDAAAGRAAGGDLVGALRSRRCRVGRRLLVARPAGPGRVHRAYRRPCLCAARHHLRHPPHRARQRRGEARASLRRPPRARRRPPAPGLDFDRAGAAPGRAGAGRRPLRPGAGAPSHQEETHQPRRTSAEAPRLGAGRGACIRGGRDRFRSGRSAAGLGPLRALAGVHHPRAGGRRAPDAAGAVRRHGGGAPPHAVLPSDAAGEGGHRGAALRRPARERHPRRPGARAPPRRRVPHRRRLGDRAARRRRRRSRQR